MTASDYRRDAPLLRLKLLEFRPAIACFHGATGYRAYLRYAEHARASGEIVLGRQEHTIGGSEVFVVPNPSPANARYSLQDFTSWYAALGRLREELKGA